MSSHHQRHRWVSRLAAFSAVLALAGLGVATPHALADVKLAPVTVAADTSRVEPGVVRIDTTLDLQGATGTGTGVVLSPDGVVLTNNHVVRGANGITVMNVGNGQSYPADVVGYDRKSDIAVLQLRGAQNLPVAPTGGAVDVGEAVTSVGFPDGGGLTRSPGTVRALGQDVVASDDLTGSSEQLSGLIGFNADIRPGNSGGPLVDDAGQVVGIVTAASRGYQMDSASGFAIPADRALAVADAIRSGNDSGSVHIGPTAILGVAITSARARTGVPVEGVLRGGPAQQAGVAPGDIITAVDSTPTPDGTALTDVLDGHRPGDTVTLSYLDRQGDPRTAPVTLAAGPSN